MESLFVLIPISIAFIALIAGLFLWAVRSGQYDDLERPRHDILLDEDDPGPSSEKRGDDGG